MYKRQVIIGQVFDLALTKEINTNQTPGPYAPGDQVQFNITVFNQGTLDAYDVDIVDDAPVGLSLPTLIGGGPIGATQNAPGDFSIAFIPAGESRRIRVRSFIDATFQGASLVNDAEITGGSDVDGGPDVMDVDSAPGDDATPEDLANDNDIADSNGGDDQDPAEVEVVQVFDLALRKELSSAGPIAAGTTVTFTITVFNQGCLLYTSPSPRD